MNLDRYLSDLQRELRLRWTPSARFVEETRGHLSDAVEAGVRRGLTPEAAWEEARLRFGEARTVAARFAAERYRRLEWVMLAPAVITGLAIAWIDSRPHWDDAGITAGLLLLGSGLLGLGMTRRAWMIALAVGAWIPLYLMVDAVMAHAVTMRTLSYLIILVFPMAGAYAGMGLRRLAMRG